MLSSCWIRDIEEKLNRVEKELSTAEKQKTQTMHKYKTASNMKKQTHETTATTTTTAMRQRFKLIALAANPFGSHTQTHTTKQISQYKHGWRR